jgi:P-type E1-E2 ATPase
VCAALKQGSRAGVVLSGRSAVDESLVTGESMPVTKDTGDRLIGGAINGSGALIMRADKIGADTMLAQIVQMVAQAQRSRAPIQRLTDRVAAWFVPLVLAVAVVAFAAWAMLDDPAATWIWTQDQVACGAIDRATPEDITAFFTPLQQRAAAAGQA